MTRFGSRATSEDFAQVMVAISPRRSGRRTADHPPRKLGRSGRQHPDLGCREIRTDQGADRDRLTGHPRPLLAHSGSDARRGRRPFIARKRTLQRPPLRPGYFLGEILDQLSDIRVPRVPLAGVASASRLPSESTSSTRSIFPRHMHGRYHSPIPSTYEEEFLV